MQKIENILATQSRAVPLMVEKKAGSLSGAFIRCVQNKQNEYVEYEDVNNDFAETGVKQ